MNFDVKKAQNCFANAENYEYRLPISGGKLLNLLGDDLAVRTRINSTLRRPTFYAELPDGERIKGLMDKNIIKVGYCPEHAQAQKQDFEHWLKAQASA